MNAKPNPTDSIDESSKQTMFAFSPVSGPRKVGDFATASQQLTPLLPDLEGEKRRDQFDRLWALPIHTTDGLSVTIASFDRNDGEVLVNAPASFTKPTKEFKTAYSNNIEIHSDTTAASMADYISDIESSHTHRFELQFSEEWPGDSLLQGPTLEALTDSSNARGLFLDTVNQEFSSAEFDWTLTVTVAVEDYYRDRRQHRLDRFKRGEVFPLINKFFSDHLDILDYGIQNAVESDDDDTDSRPKPNNNLVASKKQSDIESRIKKLSVNTYYGFDINIRGYVRVPVEQDHQYERFAKRVRDIATIALPKGEVSAAIVENPDYPNEITVDDGDRAVRTAVSYQPQLGPLRLPRDEEIPGVSPTRRAYQPDSKELWNFLTLLDYNSVRRDQQSTSTNEQFDIISE